MQQNAMKEKAPKLTDFWQRKFAAGGPPVTWLFSQRLGAVLAWLGFQLRLSPSMVTLLAGFCAILGAALYALLPTSLDAAWLSFILLQCAYALDCADGQLARATGRSSELGAWLDVFMDFLGIVSLSFAILYCLLIQSADLVLAFISVAVLTAGRVVCLYTASWFRQEAKQSIRPQGGVLLIFRHVVAVLTDLPVVLLFVVVFRHEPRLLSLYALFIGLLFGLYAAYTGIKASR